MGVLETGVTDWACVKLVRGATAGVRLHKRRSNRGFPAGVQVLKRHKTNSHRLKLEVSSVSCDLRSDALEATSRRASLVS